MTEKKKTHNKDRFILPFLNPQNVTPSPNETVFTSIYAIGFSETVSLNSQRLFKAVEKRHLTQPPVAATGLLLWAATDEQT